MAFDVQKGYQETHGVAVPGMIADTRFKTVRSLNYEGASTGAPVKFGKAVTFTTNDNGCDLGGSVFAGIVVSQQTNEEQDAFKIGQTLGAMTEGAIWVEPIDAVVPGDPVQFNPATGDIGKGAGTVIPDAVFESTAAPGELARVFMK